MQWRIIEAMLAAEQGVKNVTVGYGQCGNLVQDVAALRVLEELTEEYLDKYGYEDVTVTSVLHQWTGGFRRMSPRHLRLSPGKLRGSTGKSHKSYC